MSNLDLILVTAAASRTSLHAIRGIAARKGRVRAFIRRQEVAPLVWEAGAAEIVFGDLTNAADVAAAMVGVERVYYVPPRLRSDETEIGLRVLHAAAAARVRHFVFHSVFQAQRRGLPHHERKLAVEQALIDTDLAYTILQPPQYMQNILADWPMILAEGRFSRPHSIDKKIALVDLADMGDAAARVLTEDGFFGGTFETCSDDSLTPREMAEAVGRHLGRTIAVKQESMADWKARVGHKFDAPFIEAFTAMNEHYDAHGLPGGNGRALGMILGRAANNYAAFLRRVIEQSR